MTPGPLSAKNLRLLRQVLDHWERNLACAKAGNIWAFGMGTAGCAFCKEYFRLYDDASCCAGCPIYSTTGEQYCRGTPYFKAETALSRARDAASADRPSETRGLAHAQLVTAIEAELTFLRSLEGQQHDTDPA